MFKMSAQSSDQAEAMSEILDSIRLCTFSMRQLGLTFEQPRFVTVYMVQKIMVAASVLTIFYHTFSDVAFMAEFMANSPKVEDIVPTFHTFGFGLLCTAKVLVLWYKKDVFGQRLRELVEIWPMPPLNDEAQSIKAKSLNALRIAHRIFFSINAYGVWFYNLTPIVVYLYGVYWLNNADTRFGFIWKCWYPFDKYKPINHAVVYIFEMFVGVTCVWACLGCDLLFTAMTSHICMLLRILQQRLESMQFASTDPQQDYKELIDCIKIHQKLIKYCNEIEKAFSIANLMQIFLSSINICCVLFVIVLLEPLFALSNKLFLCSALCQIGIICFYADDIIKSNAEVAVSAYKSNWHVSDLRCRRALLFLITRSQKTIAITAMGFTKVDLVTYTSILTRSYSYFTLLCSMFTRSNRF